MPDPENKTDTQTTTPDGSGDTGETPEQREARSRAFFGIKDKPESKADPSDPNKPTPSDPDAKGDPDKEPPKGTTSDDGSGDKKGDDTTPQYAGKFQTPEALEEGYKSQTTHIKTLESENKTMRGELATFKAEIEKLKNAQPASNGDKPKGDDETILADLRKNPKFAAAREKMEYLMGEDGVKAWEEAQVEVYKLAKGGSESDSETANRLAQLEQQAFEREFYANRPEAKEPAIKKAVDALVLEIQEKGSDQHFMMNLIVDAVKGKMLPELIDKGVLSKVKSMAQKDKEALLAGTLTVDDTKLGPKGATGETDKSREEKAREYWGLPKK